MTTLVALYDELKKGVWIGSDTQTTFWDMPLKVGPKWVIHNNWAIGFSGDVRFRNLITPFWAEIVEKEKDIHHITTELKSRAVQWGYKAKEEDFPKFKQYPIITDSRDIWGIGTDLSYTRCPAGHLMASGSGLRFAIGAFHALKQHCPQMDTQAMITAAIQAPIEHDIYSGGEAWVQFMPSVVAA